MDLVDLQSDSDMSRYSFPKSMRLLSNNQFRIVLARRNSARDNILTIYACENGLEYSRLGISVGKSAGNAVVRNRIKRLVREAFRLNQHNIAAGLDYVVTTRLTKDSKTGKSPVKDMKFEQIEASFLALIVKLTS